MLYGCGAILPRRLQMRDESVVSLINTGGLVRVGGGGTASSRAAGRRIPYGKIKRADVEIRPAGRLALGRTRGKLCVDLGGPLKRIWVKPADEAEAARFLELVLERVEKSA
jgi:hypothetical protein